MPGLLPEVRSFLLLVAANFFLSPLCIAATDLEAQEGFAQARANSHQTSADHSAHKDKTEKQVFRGVFYGFLPCDDCLGIKNTLSLKKNNKYLMVTQFAREASREYYEKGVYSWNDTDRTLVLTPNQETSPKRYYKIKDESTLVMTRSDGSPVNSNSDRYVLQRSDNVQSREIHMH